MSPYLHTDESRFLPALRVDGHPELVVPPLACPFLVVRPSTHSAPVQAETLRWLEAYRLAEARADLLDCVSAVGELTALTYPGASRESLRLASDWTTLFFLMDDLVEERGADLAAISALNARYLAVLGGEAPGAEEGPVLHALWDVRERLAGVASAQWLRRFRGRVKEWLGAHVWEARNRADRTVPDVASYVHMRQYSVGMYFEFLLSELTDGYALPAEVESHEAVAQLARHANNQIAWANDVMTLGKELRQGDVHNLVMSLWKREGLELQAALERAVAMHNEEVARFQALARGLPSFGEADGAVQGLVRALRHYMGGHLGWGYSARRYRPLEVGAP